MRRFALSLLLAGAMVLAAPSALESQVHDPAPLPRGFMSPAWGEGPVNAHAAVVALEEWRDLGLSAKQVSRIRQIQSEMVMFVIEVLIAQGSDTLPSAWWLPGVEIDEAEVRALHQRHAVRDADLTLRVMKASRAVFELLSPEQQQHLRRLMDSWAPIGFTGSRPHTPCTEGSRSGGMSLSPRTALYDFSSSGENRPTSGRSSWAGWRSGCWGRSPTPMYRSCPALPAR
jgi:hypothetical protein